jgi:hypothetical protein
MTLFTELIKTQTIDLDESNRFIVVPSLREGSAESPRSVETTASRLPITYDLVSRDRKRRSIPLRLFL